MTIIEGLKILAKTREMIGYGYAAIEQFPKRAKFSFGKEMEQIMLNTVRLVIRTNKKYYKKTTLQELDIEIATLKLYVRMAHEMRLSNSHPPFLPMKKYEIWSKKLDEIGRMLGGWIKSQK